MKDRPRRRSSVRPGRPERVAVLLQFLTLPLWGCLGTDFAVEADVAAFSPRIHGDFALGSGPSVDDISLSSDLDIDDQEVEPYFRAKGEVLGFELEASYFATEQEGTGILTADFGNITVGSAVSSTMDLAAGRLALTWDLFDLGFLEVSPGLAVEYLDIELVVEEPVFDLSEEISVEQPVPMLALGLEGRLPKIPLRLTADFAGIVAGFEDLDGLVLDSEIRLEYELWSWCAVFAGYRRLIIELEGRADGQEFDGDIDIDGFMLGLGLRF